MKKVLLAISLLTLLLTLSLGVSAQGEGTSLNASVVFGTIIVREAPELTAPEIARAAQGESLTITGRTESGEWYQVALEDGTGWVAEYLVALEGSAAALPVIAVAAPQSDRLYVPPGCDQFGIGPFFGKTGQSVILTQGWEAASRELVDEYISSVIQIVSFDGRLVSTYSAYRTDVFYNEPTDTWRVFWSFDMGPVAAGQHTTEWTQMFNRQITDGLDHNGDGQPDQYGPEATTATCTLIIE
ncbi:MAG: SH3 domain-containing protein [Anaerolineae bacterium]|nr:SH3 domain-containing protein [Anaerolineae bacterium]